jgi:hypothetical protein
MRIQVFTSLAAATLVSLALAPAPAAAKTAKDCRKEWQADKAAMQAAHKTEKVYVAECSGKATAKTASPVKEDKGGY